MPIFSLTDFAKEQVQAVQDYSLLAGRSISNLFTQPRYFSDTLMQADMVGVGSLPIVVLTGFFTGAVLALQTSSTLQQFGSSVSHRPTGIAFHGARVRSGADRIDGCRP